MVEFISNLIPNEFLATTLMSLLPLIELKGGIVFARGAGLGFLGAFLLAYVGSTVAFFPVFFLLRPILNFLKKIKWFNKFACKVENYFLDKANKTLAERKDKNGKKAKLSSEKFLKQLGVFVFVAIPLPMTGIWTGTAIAVFLSLKFKDAVLPVVLGNLVAGAIISILAEVCMAVWSLKALDYVLYGLFALAVILLVVVIFKVGSKKTESVERQKDDQNG